MMFWKEMKEYANSKRNDQLDNEEWASHIALGYIEELGEVTSLLNKHLFRGKPLLRSRLVEELSDLAFYIAAEQSPTEKEEWGTFMVWSPGIHWYPVGEKIEELFTLADAPKHRKQARYEKLILQINRISSHTPITPEEIFQTLKTKLDARAPVSAPARSKLEWE